MASSEEIETFAAIIYHPGKVGKIRKSAECASAFCAVFSPVFDRNKLFKHRAVFESAKMLLITMRGFMRTLIFTAFWDRAGIPAKKLLIFICQFSMFSS